MCDRAREIAARAIAELGLDQRGRVQRRARSQALEHRSATERVHRGVEHSVFRAHCALEALVDMGRCPEDREVDVDEQRGVWVARVG